ncbi:hypothetical protein [Bacillus norwichensis]|uniref:Uncharacterized protein n=1 Tax=Bacillus norwichensis TaxID=2762217 RepID=A0ABR8VSP7_9BACI|nr:hypothetical protein [Bacillus norwichensis]MBD8007541.1 hypothetical protein [Bacillus norwichensis]
MQKFLTSFGMLLLLGVSFSPLLANWLWDDPFIIIGSSWFVPAICASIALLILPPILSNVFGVGTLKAGQPAVGLITSIRQTGTVINNKPEVKLELMVTRQDHDKYPAKLRMIVSVGNLPQFQPGSVIPLLVSVKNPNKIGFDAKGHMNQNDLQSLFNEQLVKQGLSPELADIAQTWEKGLAKVMDVVPLGMAASGKVQLQLTLVVTKPNGETFKVTVQKELIVVNLARVQQGQIINVIYSPLDPTNLTIALPVTEQEIRQTFGT